MIEIKKVNSEEKLSETEIEKKLRELGDYDPTLELSSFKMPSIDLLNSHGASEIKIDINHQTCFRAFFGIGFVPPLIRCQKIGTQGC